MHGNVLNPVLLSLYNQSSSIEASPEEVGALLIFIFAMILILILSIPYIIGLWKIYTKMGLPGWECLIPFYGEYQLGSKVLNTDKGGWIFLGLDIAVPVLNWIVPKAASPVALGINIYKSIMIARCFGKSMGFAIGLAWLPFIFYPILGFGNSTYLGPTDPLK